MLLIDASTKCLCVCTILNFWAVLDCHLSCWLIHLRSQAETICLFTHRCHFMGFVPFTLIRFSNLLWLFSQWILTSPQRHHLKVVGESFQFPLKSYPEVLCQWCSFHSLLKHWNTLPMSFPCKNAVLWYNVIIKNVQITVKIEIVNLKRWKHPNGDEYCLELLKHF